MLGILVGVVTAYDEAEGRATVRLRSPLRRGDFIHIVGNRTDCEVKLKARRFSTARGDQAGGDAEEVDVLVPPVEPGDMVFRIVGEQRSYTSSVA